MYQYNGKELVEDNGLGWNAYGKRYYDTTIGRFPNVDPLIDTFHFVTGYNYAENEPVAHIDLWGLQKVSANYRISVGVQGQYPVNPLAGSTVSGSIDLMSVTLAQGSKTLAGEASPPTQASTTESLDIHQSASLEFGPIGGEHERSFTAYTSDGGSSDPNDQSEAHVNLGPVKAGVKNDSNGNKELFIKVEIDFKMIIGVKANFEASYPID